MVNRMARRTKLPKTRRGAWFVPVRGSYLPASAAGWWTYAPFVAYLIASLIIGVRDESSPLLAFLFIIPNWIAAGAIMTYIAARKS